MNFEIFSRREMESFEYYDNNYIKQTKHVVISIKDPEEFPAAIASLDSCKGILRLTFHDVDEDFPDNNYTMFNEEHANKILSFVEEHKDSVDLIIVHCHGGISRSAGVAAALALIVNGSDADVIKVRPSYNRFVYRVLLNAYLESTGVIPDYYENN